jgi:pimeloyl-ACP methyl ester carboxylesterase
LQRHKYFRWRASKLSTANAILHTIETANVTFSYFEYGNPEGKPVILLHGFPDSPISYQDVIDKLDAKALRLIVPYLRGFGETVVTQPESVGGQEAALGHDLLAFAGALSIDKFNLVGHDWGARTSYEACIFAPDRVKSLLALATPYIMFGGKRLPCTDEGRRALSLIAKMLELSLNC